MFEHAPAWLKRHDKLARAKWRESKVTPTLDVEKCDLCEAELNEGHLVVDTPVSRGPWGHLCTPCAVGYGTPGLGTLHTVKRISD